MSVIHKVCGTKLVSTASIPGLEIRSPGDWGFCPKCKKRVDHLVMLSGGLVGFSKEVIIKED